MIKNNLIPEDTKTKNIPTEGNINNLPKLLTPKQVKEYLGVGNDKLYQLLKERTFPSIRIGGKFYILEKDLAEWIEKQMTKSKIRHSYFK